MSMLKRFSVRRWLAIAALLLAVAAVAVAILVMGGDNGEETAGEATPQPDPITIEAEPGGFDPHTIYSGPRPAWSPCSQRSAPRASRRAFLAAVARPARDRAS